MSSGGRASGKSGVTVDGNVTLLFGVATLQSERLSKISIFLHLSRKGV